MATDQYKIISSPVEGITYKDRNSKFLGFAYPVANEDEIKTILAELRQQHKGANHVCYAWQLGVEPLRWRANDDGEPNNSAGLPIYGQIQAYGITDVLVAVVRFFGGTKLGVGGLISAYRQTAQMTLEEVRIITKTLFCTLIFEFDYQSISSVMRLLKKNQLEFQDQSKGAKAQYKIEVPRNKLMVIKKKLEAIKGVQLSKCT